MNVAVVSTAGKGCKAPLVAPHLHKVPFRMHAAMGLVLPTAVDLRETGLVAATKDLVGKGFKAGDAVRQMAELVGGKGGGKPDLAQAGGTDPSKIPQALERLYELVKV